MGQDVWWEAAKLASFSSLPILVYGCSGLFFSSHRSDFARHRQTMKLQSPLHEKILSMQEIFDAVGPQLGHITQIRELIETDSAKYAKIFLDMEAGAYLFKLLGSADWKGMLSYNYALKEEEYAFYTELLQLFDLLSQLDDGIKAIVSTKFAVRDLYLYLYRSPLKDIPILLNILLRISQFSTHGVCAIHQGARHAMYVNREPLRFCPFVKYYLSESEEFTEANKEVIAQLLIQLLVSQPLDQPSVAKDLCNQPELILALQTSAGKIPLELASMLHELKDQDFSEFPLLNPNDEEARFKEQTDRHLRFFLCLWETTPAVFPASMKTHTPEEQYKRLEEVRKMTFDSQFADLETKKAINRKVSAMCCGVDEYFFGGVLAREGMFTATREFVDRALAYDPALTDDEMHKAGRNLWTCLALQLVVCRVKVECQPAIFGYSMLYPYTDDYLDDNNVTLEDKVKFQKKFTAWLDGTGNEPPSNPREVKVKHMVEEIESKWDRKTYPQVYYSLLAINDAQTRSLDLHKRNITEEEVFEIGVDKGGTSVLADTWLAAADSVTDRETAFGYVFGVALQFLDDVQDVRRDVKDNQQTPMTVAYEKGYREEFGKFVKRLINIVEILIHPDTNNVTDKDEYYLRMCMLQMCYSIVLKALAKDEALFEPSFISEVERYSPLPFQAMKKIVLIKKLMTLVRKDII